MKKASKATPNLPTIDANAPIQEAAAKMKDEGASALAVVEAGRVVGVLTERGIVTGFVAEGLDYSGTTACDVMTRGEEESQHETHPRGQGRPQFPGPG